MIGINTFMKKFHPTYLYIKTHNKTGLKYFGKTTSSEPHKYKGSGSHWLDHLKIHGNDVHTDILGLFESKDECVSTAIQFSTDNDIVKATDVNGKKIWANQVIENGLDGGDTGRTDYKPHTSESKKKISEAKKGQVPWNIGLTGATPGNKHPKTNEQKAKISESLKGRKRDPDAIKKTADKLRGRKRPEISKRLTGIKRTSETIEKMKLAQQNRSPMSEDTKQKIRDARKLQVITQETKDKLKGKIVCVNKNGEIKKIDKEIFSLQTGPIEERDWVFHKSKEGIRRRG